MFKKCISLQITISIWLWTGRGRFPHAAGKQNELEKDRIISNPILDVLKSLCVRY